MKNAINIYIFLTGSSDSIQCYDTVGWAEPQLKSSNILFQLSATILFWDISPPNLE